MVDKKVSNKKSCYTYISIVGDNANPGLVLPNRHSGNESDDVLSNVLEVLVFDGTGRVENEVKVDAEIVGAAVFFATRGHIAVPVAVHAHSVGVVRNSDLDFLLKSDSPKTEIDSPKKSIIRNEINSPKKSIWQKRS